MRRHKPPQAVILALALQLIIYSALPARAADMEVFSPLAEVFVAQGFSRQQAEAWLASPKLKFQDKLMVSMLAISEYKRNYAQFLSKKSLQSCEKFLSQNRAVLQKVQQDTGVSPELVTAIIKIESNLGSYQGKWLVFNMLASQAVLDTEPAIRRLKKRWPRDQMAVWGTEKHYIRLARKAAWARDELTWLAQLAELQDRSPFDYIGSPAGAMGMGQFVPSSVLRWGADGDGNGSLDLSNRKDAIASVGNYLRKHGWRPGLSRPEQMEVIKHYNRSTPYANTVLDLMEMLK